MGWIKYFYFNRLATELNPSSPNYFAGVFKFCACFSENLNISRTKRDKFCEIKAVCGEWIRHCSECLKRSIYCSEMYKWLHEFSIKTVPDTSLHNTSNLV